MRECAKSSVNSGFIPHNCANFQSQRCGASHPTVPRRRASDGWMNCNATSVPAAVHNFQFDQLGVRVPAVIVSPLIPRSVINHTRFDHSSVSRTLCRLFGMNTVPPGPTRLRRQIIQQYLSVRTEYDARRFLHESRLRLRLRLRLRRAKNPIDEWRPLRMQRSNTPGKNPADRGDSADLTLK
jgi:hypothetical protein